MNFKFSFIVYFNSYPVSNLGYLYLEFFKTLQIELCFGYIHKSFGVH